MTKMNTADDVHINDETDIIWHESLGGYCVRYTSKHAEYEEELYDHNPPSFTIYTDHRTKETSTTSGVQLVASPRELLDGFISRAKAEMGVESTTEVTVYRVTEQDEAIAKQNGWKRVVQHCEQVTQSSDGARLYECGLRGRGTLVFMQEEVVKSEGIVGLVNLGNTCYMNAALQCLRAMPALSNYIRERSVVLETEDGMSTAYGQLLDKFYSTKDMHSFAPTAFRSAMRRHMCEFDNNKQHDSQEFINLLLARLESNVFGGQYESSIECNGCGARSVTREPYSSLQLQVPAMTTLKQVFVFHPRGRRPLQYEMQMDANFTVHDVKQRIGAQCQPRLPADKIRMALVENGRIYEEFTDDSALASEGRKRAYPRHIHLFELELSVNEAVTIPVLQHCTYKWHASIGVPCPQYISLTYDEARNWSEKCKVTALRTVKQLTAIPLFRLPKHKGSHAVQRAARDSDNREVWSDLTQGEAVDESECIRVAWDKATVEAIFGEHLEHYVGDEREMEVQDIVSTKDQLSLERCLETTYQQAERVQRPCSMCKSEQEATKRLTISTLPDTLMLHLVRWQVHGDGKCSKLHTAIDYPTESLNLNDMMGEKAGDQDYTYDLVAVILHSGDGDTGHYTADVRSVPDGQWWRYDDSTAPRKLQTSCSPEEAYLLFYHRRAASLEASATVRTFHSSMQDD